MTVSAFAALAAKQALVPYDYEPAPLSRVEVEIDISHCGICHSDLHLIDNWRTDADNWLGPNPTPKKRADLLWLAPSSGFRPERRDEQDYDEDDDDEGSRGEGERDGALGAR